MGLGLELGLGLALGHKCDANGQAEGCKAGGGLTDSYAHPVGADVGGVGCQTYARYGTDARRTRILDAPCHVDV